MELKDKIVVITGGGRGLGKAFAQQLVVRAAKVIISGRDEEELRKTAKEIGTEAVVTDVTKEADVQNLAQQAVSKFGKIDIWINNAALWMPHATIENMDLQLVHQLLEVNLFGTIYGSKAALIQMRKQGTGCIVNILSTSALEGRAGSSGYGASKFAAMGFTKALRKETEGSGIKVLAIYPGGMQTNLFDAKRPEDYGSYMQPDFVVEKILKNLSQETPEEELIIRRPK